MNISLCGMMGVGKTTVGKLLSERLHMTLIDTDSVIVSRHGSISKLFEEKGEGYFRDLERGLGEELSADKNAVISTGGGFVLREENAEALKKNGVLIFLNASVSTLLSRVTAEDRPLLKGGAEKKLKELIPLRYPVYERVSSFVVDTDGKTAEEVADEITRRIRV